METIPHHRIIPTQTIQRQQKKITPNRRKNQTNHKRKTDITLQELIDELSLNVGESGLSRRLKKMGLTYKKRHSIQTTNNEMMLPRQEILGEKHKKS
jgi:transposase